jgi:hypothetical protein
MSDMPTAVQIEQQFGGVGALQSRIRTLQREQLDTEARGRLTRDAQVQDNCTVQGSLTCPLTGEAAGTPVAVRVDFGRIRFTSRPVFTYGARVPGRSELLLGGAYVDDTAWESDAKGLYRAAWVVCLYVGTPLSATSMTIDYLFCGPALRGAS